MPFDEEKQIQQLVSLYRRGFEEILRIIVEKEAKGQWTQYWRDLLLEVRAILQQLDQYADQWIEQTIGQVYSQAAAQTAVFLSQLGIEKLARPEFAQIHQRAIDVVAQNMADNLRDATQFIGRRINDVFRRVGLEQIGRKLAAGQTWQDMKQKVVQQLLDRGQTAFVDRLGRKWRLDAYASMVTRTTTREAASVATLNTCQEFGLDLVRITTHYPTCEKCASLQGKVYSISGRDSRYPKLTDERRPPIHPNCRHVLVPYVRELDDNAEETERLSNQPLDRDPRSEAEKQTYAEMRDAVTIATNRKRAREVLYNEAAPLEDKLKAARKLQRSYEKTGQKPKGRDAAILKQYRDWLDEQNLVKRVGHIEPKMFEVIAGNITTNEVVLTKERLKHIMEKHPGEWEALEPYLAQALKDPDYILRDKKRRNTGIVIKKLEQENMFLALRLQTADEMPGRKNSIITLFRISEKRLKGYLLRGDAVYIKIKPDKI
ncbi:MAG: hypothetical protein K6T66_06575 [Peptococcaceae bacterium]|nr:hypothetical protein [Peptococcaceae bacterium]